MLEKIIKCFGGEKYLYSQHAREEMEVEELGEIKGNEVFEAVLNGKIIEDYPEDKPYPSCLIYGKTSDERPLHIVCAYAELVCLSCGERYYDRKAMKKIEEMRSKLRKHDLKLEEVGKVLREQTA